MRVCRPKKFPAPFQNFFKSNLRDFQFKLKFKSINNCLYDPSRDHVLFCCGGHSHRLLISGLAFLGRIVLSLMKRCPCKVRLDSASFSVFYVREYARKNYATVEIHLNRSLHTGVYWIHPSQRIDGLRAAKQDPLEIKEVRKNSSNIVLCEETKQNFIRVIGIYVGCIYQHF